MPLKRQGANGSFRKFRVTGGHGVGIHHRGAEDTKRRSVRLSSRRSPQSKLVLVHRSRFTVHRLAAVIESKTGVLARCSLTEPCHTPPKILSLQRRNDGRGRPFHNAETWRGSRSTSHPYYQPLFRFPSSRPLHLCGESPSGFGVLGFGVRCTNVLLARLLVFRHSFDSRNHRRAGSGNSIKLTVISSGTIPPRRTRGCSRWASPCTRLSA
jgi:hypothetical protein